MPRRQLTLLCISRFGTCTASMMFAGSLPYLLAPWQMTPAQAGSVQAAYNFAYAISLLVASWLADRLGAKRVFFASIWASALAAIGFAAGARSYIPATLLFTLVAIAQGGTYTPSIMLVADGVESAQRGRAIGWTLAAASLGYLASIGISVTGSVRLSYVHAFYIAAAGPLLGAIAGSLALAGTTNLVHRRQISVAPQGEVWRAMMSRESALLTIGYTAHCWELLGMWAWAPAFLAAALQQDPLAGSAYFGLGIAAAIHLAGFASTASMGGISDRLGRRAVLILVAWLGSLISFAYGWCNGLPAWQLLPFTFAYGFAALGDSGVLSAAMTEAVPARYLGTLLALRSIFGFGAGAVSALAFGWILDATNPGGGLPQHWGWAFVSLGIGGMVAAAAAMLLPWRPSESAS